MADSAYLPIRELSCYQASWLIRARVTSKAPMRVFNSKRGPSSAPGKVFHVQLLDAQGGEIRVSFFGDAADKFNEQLEVGKCYTFSKGEVKVANRQYNTCNHRYEITYSRADTAQIVEAKDDANIEAFKLSPTDLRKVQAATLPCTVDLCVIVTSAGPAISFTSRDGKALVKRDITVADDSALSLAVTLWGDRAKQDDTAFEGNPLVALKGVLVKEWNNGRSGSLLEAGHLVFRPTFPEAQKVQEWWANGGKSQTLTMMSQAGGGAGGKPLNGKAVDLAEIRRACEQVADQTEQFTVCCRLALVQMRKQGEVQPLVYMACQEPKEGKGLPCNRRLDPSGFCTICNRAGKAAPRFNLRCKFSDFADSVWLTTFHEAAHRTLGMTAEQAMALEQGTDGREKLEGAMKKCYFSQPLQLLVRAKLDTYNGEPRANVTCVDARPVSRGEHGRSMLAEIQAMLAMRDE